MGTGPLSGMGDSGMRRHLREALGGDEGGDSDHGVVAEMEKETGDDSAGAGAREGENDADESEESNKAPGPAELRTVHQAKESSGDHNAWEDAERFGEKRIEIAAKNGFFDERRDEYGHGHQQHGAGAALEEFLDGNVVHILDARTGDGDKDGQAAPRKEIHPGTALAGNGAGVQFFPAQRAPKRKTAEHGERHIQKKKYESEPEDISADEEL